jgi:hypothetical protein
MDIRAIESIRHLQQQVASLLLYRSVLSSEVGQAFLDLLDALYHSDVDGAIACLNAYGRLFQALARHNRSWQDDLIARILRDDNPFSRAAQTLPFHAISPVLVEAAKHDLNILHNLYRCSSTQLANWVKFTCKLPDTPVTWSDPTQSYSVPLAESWNWEECLEELAAYYHKYGIGIFADYRALRWESGQLIGIPHPDPVTLTELTGYEFQKQTLVRNTEFLLAGYPAQHILLYGSRGSGKSSLVKAVANRYSDRNLRLIEVAKSDLRDLPQIIDPLRSVPQKFIIFVDDLSFEDDDDAFKALKVVLEGSATARPENVVVYATSNRRHLVREFFDERLRPSISDEVHAWDTTQEKLSFSDRFGITLTFEPADQTTYLAIVRHLSERARLAIDPSELESRALEWATRRNGRSGRTARQFVNFMHASLKSDGD